MTHDICTTIPPFVDVDAILPHGPTESAPPSTSSLPSPARRSKLDELASAFDIMNEANEALHRYNTTLSDAGIEFVNDVTGAMTLHQILNVLGAGQDGLIGPIGLADLRARLAANR